MARKYRGGGTAAQRRRINPPAQPQGTVQFHLLVPTGMPVEHLLPPTVGGCPGFAKTVPIHDALWAMRGVTSFNPCAPIRQVYNAVPGPNLNLGNGWLYNDWDRADF